MEFCPKCGHERRPTEDDFVPKNECPKCGIIYEKYAERQRKLNEATKTFADREKPQTSSFIRNLAIWFLICVIATFIFKALNKIDKAKVDMTGTESAKMPQTPMPPSKSSHSRAANHSGVSSGLQHQIGNTVNQDLISTKDRLTRISEQQMSSYQVLHNSIASYEWRNIKDGQNYKKIKLILQDYRLRHTYMGNDLFVCLDMAIDVWNLLATAGIKSKLLVGNINTNIELGSTVIRYLGDMSHVWLLAEVSRSVWIPLETTGGFIVEPSNPGFSLYNMGTAFENPKECKEFNAARNALFQAHNEIVFLQDGFNQLHAGKRITAETTEYMGRIKQKLDDYEKLFGRVTAFLKVR